VDDRGLIDPDHRDSKFGRHVHRIFSACLGEYTDESETA